MALYKFRIIIFRCRDKLRRIWRLHDITSRRCRQRRNRCSVSSAVPQQSGDGHLRSLDASLSAGSHHVSTRRCSAVPRDRNWLSVSGVALGRDARRLCDVCCDSLLQLLRHAASQLYAARRRRLNERTTAVLHRHVGVRDNDDRTNCNESPLRRHLFLYGD